MDEINGAEEEVLQRHRKERKELQGKIQSLKKSSNKSDKKRKKEIIEEIARLELELENRHSEELMRLKDTPAPAEEVQDEVVPSETTEKMERSGQRISKAQKRRDKKAIKEKEREQLIIAQERENLHGARNLETQKLKHMLKERNLMIQEIPSDGNCLYCAVDEQRKLVGENGLGIEKLREMTSEYLRSHRSDFLPFLSNPKTGDILTEEEYEEYCDQVANTSAWGGEIELRALSHVLKSPIEVVQANGPQLIIGEEYHDKKPLTVTFHRHMYGLGEHYNSVKPYVETDPEEEPQDCEKS